MGTRSTTIIKEGSTTLCTMYCQFDGYPEGHGQELAEFLKDFTIVNGYSNDTPKPAANDVGCLAAQIIGHFKTGIGGAYLVDKAAPGYHGDEWAYEVRIKKGEINLKVTEVGWGEIPNKVWFDGGCTGLLEKLQLSAEIKEITDAF